MTFNDSLRTMQQPLQQRKQNSETAIGWNLTRAKLQYKDHYNYRPAPNVYVSFDKMFMLMCPGYTTLPFDHGGELARHTYYSLRRKMFGPFNVLQISSQNSRQ